MRFTKSGGQTAVGPEAWFTGTVYIDSIRNPDEQSRVGSAHVAVHPWCTDRMAHPPCTSPTASTTSSPKWRGARDPSR